jgi:pimeloyl-ACP methyl ester carboxylesterase
MALTLNIRLSRVKKFTPTGVIYSKRLSKHSVVKATIKLMLKTYNFFGGGVLILYSRCVIILMVPKNKTKKSKKTPKKRLGSHKRPFIGLKRDVLGFVTILIIASIWAIVIGLLSSHPPGLGGTSIAQAAPSDYRDLDLSVARGINYTNSPLRIVKDLGSTDGVERAIVSFGVPKDGFFEYAFMTRPASPPPTGGYPVIIMCHGFADPATYSTPGTYTDDMKFYARHGFMVVKPDFRGQGLSLGKGTADSPFYSMAYNTDVMSLIAALKKTANVSPSAINIWGHSMGAYIALRAAVVSPDIKSAILLAPPGDLVDQAKLAYVGLSDRDNSTALKTRQRQLALHGKPLDNLNYWQKTSPLNYLAGSKAYFQIHVGSDDEVVPTVFSAQINNKLSELNLPHDYFIYYGSGHALSDIRQLIWQRSLTALGKG